MKKYIVELTTDHREELLHMISTGKAAARELTHACILLKADQDPCGPTWSDRRIQEALEVSASTVQRVRKCCAARGTQHGVPLSDLIEIEHGSAKKIAKLASLEVSP